MSQLTDLFHAFANIVDGRAVLPNGDADTRNIAAFAAAKQDHPEQRVTVSIGDWGAAGFLRGRCQPCLTQELHPAAARPAQRPRRRGTCPRRATAAHRSAAGRTPAVAGPYDPNASFELRQVGHILDWINLMTYDLENGYSALTGFNAPLRPDPADPTPEIIKRYNFDVTAVEYYRAHGVPVSKIVLGEPFFSGPTRHRAPPTTACTSR